MSYVVAARDDPAVLGIEDHGTRRAVTAQRDLLQTHLSEFEA
jgi:hypothetical protein